VQGLGAGSGQVVFAVGPHLDDVGDGEKQDDAEYDQDDEELYEGKTSPEFADARGEMFHCINTFG